MCLRVGLLILVLAVSLSGCGPKNLVGSAPVPVAPSNQPSAPLPPPAPDLPQPPEKDSAPATTREPQEPATSETATSSTQPIVRQPSGTGSLDTRGGPMTTGRVVLEGTRNERPPVAVNVPRGFVPGSAAYQIPRSMVENKSSPVDLWIDGSMSVEDLSDELRRYLIKNANRAADRLGVKSKSFGTTEIVRKKVLIGKKMSAELTGPDFEIQPSGPEDQVYIEGRPLRWSWLVKPKHAGPDGLPLEILVVADPGEGRTPEEPIREVLIVYAHARSLKEIFQELDWWIKLVGGSGVGAVGVGVGKWLLARRRVKRRSPKSK